MHVIMISEEQSKRDTIRVVLEDLPAKSAQRA